MSRIKDLREQFTAHMRDSETTHPVNLAVEFRKSRAWGYCPFVYFGGHVEHIATASGCGYDKESAALSEALAGLVPAVKRCHGAGVGSVIRVMREHGFALEKVGFGPSFNAYTLQRVA